MRSSAVRFLAAMTKAAAGKKDKRTRTIAAVFLESGKLIGESLADRLSVRYCFEEFRMAGVRTHSSRSMEMLWLSNTYPAGDLSLSSPGKWGGLNGGSNPQLKPNLQ